MDRRRGFDGQGGRARGGHLAPVPEGVGQSKAPALPDGAVRTTYEQMITFGVEYGPYVKLAQAFGDMIGAGM